MGEDLWAGFVAPQRIPYGAAVLDISLVGPKVGLLTVEVAVRGASRSTRGFAVQEVILAAAAGTPGILPGIIDQSGAAIELDPRGETVSDFIASLRAEGGTSEWRERVQLGYNRLTFYLDFGTLERSTDITLDNADLVAGYFVRDRLIASLTEFGSGLAFSDRAVATVAAQQSSVAAGDATRYIRPSSAAYVRLLQQRAIGPAAAVHKTEIRDRIDYNIPEFVYERHEGFLRGVDQYYLTLDCNRANARRPKLGDTVALDVVDWVPGLNVQERLHITHIESHDEDNTRDVVGAVLLE